MRKCELAALRAPGLTWERFNDLLPSTLDSLGLSVDDKGRDGSLTVRDHAELGCVVVFTSGSLARRAGLVLAPTLGENVEIFEAVGTGGEKGFRFRTAAAQATPGGELRDAEGEELDLDDPEQTWGGGALDARTQRVLRDFGQLPGVTVRTREVGLRRRSGGKASTPRVATLVKLVKKAKTWEGVPLEGGRVELKVELSTGGRQTSYCTTAEFEEVQRLTGGSKR